MMPENSICAEIGVYKGNFSHEILDIAQPKKLHLIDPWKYRDKNEYKNALFGGVAGSQDSMNKIFEEVKDKFNQEIEKGRVEIHRGASQNVYKKFPEDYFDWIYIDGNHKYKYVKKDLELYLPKIKTGGYITGDDYRKFGWWNGGIKRAVKEFSRRESIRKIKIKNSQFIIQKI